MIAFHLSKRYRRHTAGVLVYIPATGSVECGTRSRDPQASGCEPTLLDRCSGASRGARKATGGVHMDQQVHLRHRARQRRRRFQSSRTLMPSDLNTVYSKITGGSL
jgi:hypothetical protein